MSKHTPGPWHADKRGRRIHSSADPSSPVLVAEAVALHGPQTRLNQSERARAREANARLIAAAPELLEACQRLLDWSVLAGALPPLEAIELAEAAIALATGGQP